MPIVVNDEQSLQPLTEEQLNLLERVLEHGLALFQKTQAEVSVVISDNDFIQTLNRDYRGIDQPTDVLSFAIQEESVDDPAKSHLPADAPELLGDICISINRTVEQAEEYGHSFERELCYLASHGLLHLLGYDHQTEDDTEAMRREEERILASFSLGR